MSATALVNKFVFSLQDGALFSTRDLLNYGKRGAVDQAIYRLIKKDVIVRVVRGLFMKNGGFGRMPDIFEIAKAKGQAFGRQVWTGGREAGSKIGAAVSAPNERNMSVFATDGATTSFKYGSHKIVLQRTSQRKIQHKDEIAGLIIRGLWSLGRVAVTAHTIAQTIGQLGRREKVLLRNTIALMPQWLADRLHH